MPDQPKAAGGGNLKFIIAGILLLGGALGLWMMLQQPAAPVAVAPPKKADNAERVNPMAQPDLILEEAKDAGQPAAPAEVEKPKTVHHATRDEWDCGDGALPKEAIVEVINNNRAQIRNCYERRLKMNNVLQGGLSLKFKVGANGRTTAVSVSGSLHDNEVFACVRSIAQKWSFPPPSGGDCAVAEAPFQFSPKGN